MKEFRNTLQEINSQPLVANINGAMLITKENGYGEDNVVVTKSLFFSLSLFMITWGTNERFQFLCDKCKMERPTSLC
jgi:hypothetical protein